MKRTNVILDEKLLEEARRASGEKTYSATITKALEAMVKKKRFWELYDQFEEEAHKGDFFWPNYLEEIRPPGRMTRLQKKGRVAAHEKREPKKRTRRAAR
ncbi:MAG TPA: type II toxin-antitoxin system VapB family antitoxin [Thermoanaerobaculia bacterium]